MRKIFLVIAILVITASFLTGCAGEDALAGEAKAIERVALEEEMAVKTPRDTAEAAEEEAEEEAEAAEVKTEEEAETAEE